MNRFIAVAIVLAANIAVADPNKPAGAKAFAEGRELYSKGSYAAAAERFAWAFAFDPDPAYVFNVGQAYRRSAEEKADVLERDCRRAADAYKKFLSLVPEPANKKELETYIKDMEKCAGSYVDRPIDKPIDKPSDKLIEKPIDKPVDKPIDTQVGVTKRGEPSSSGKTMKLVGIVVGGAGLVGLGAGTYFGLDGRRLQNRRDKVILEMGEGSLAIDLDEQGKDANTRARIAFISGGVLMATGVTLYVLGRSKASESKRLTIAPTIGGAVAMFRF
jgi:hypothetical protein